MQIETEQSTDYLLEQWALWMRSNGDTLAYPHMQPWVIAIAIVQRRGCSPDIRDDEAMMIDGILARLIHRHPQMGRVTWDYYVSGCNVSAIARYYRIPRARVDVLVRAGTAWVDATRMARQEAA